MNKLNKPIGILGGTFDPVHNGHLHIASCVLNMTPIEEIKFIPCHQPVHRQTPHASPQDRVAMLEAAIAPYSKFSLDLREIQRPAPSFMIDTLISLRAEYPQTPLCLILGADAYANIPTWKNWQALLDYAHLVIVNRPNYTLAHPHVYLTPYTQESSAALTQHLNNSILFLCIPAHPSSANSIRQKIQQQYSITHLVPPQIATYIHLHNLYK